MTISEKVAYLRGLAKGLDIESDGKYGQLSIILPEKNAVVTVVCENRDGESLFKLINGFIGEQL